MAIKFYCKSCRRLLSIAGRKAGTDIDCPECGETQRVPSKQAAEAAMAMTRSHQLGRTDPREHDSPFVFHDPIDAGGPDADGLDEEMPSSADGALPVGMILLKRQTLFFQGILLAVLPLACLALGYFLGRCDSLSPLDAAPPEPALEKISMAGTIVWEKITDDNSTEMAGDEGAVIIALPEGLLPESIISIQGLRPQDPHPSSDHKSLKKIDELGGFYARADATGLFPLVFPQSGKYHILLISRNVLRPPGKPINEHDLEEIKRYFMHGEDLIGSYQYRWSTEEIGLESPAIEHSFGRGG